MNMIYKIVIVSLVCAIAVFAQTPPASTGKTAKSYSDEYGVIVQKNIFLKDRRSSNTSRHQNNNPPPAPVPVEKTYTLIGVAIGDQESRAYFEHAGSIVHFATGDKIGNGTITKLELNGVQYEAGDKQISVRVGQDLTGVVSSGSSSSSRPTYTSTGSTPSSSSPAMNGTSGSTETKPTATNGEATPAVSSGGDDANLSLEERMRRRRLQQTGH